MGTINSIILGIFAVLGIIGALIGLSKGLIRSVIKVASIILAIVVAFAITPSLLNTAYDVASPQIDQFLASFDELLTASPTLKEYLPNAISALISPIVFIVVFAVCLAVVAILRKIVMLILGGLLPKKRGLISRVCGFALGAVGGIMIALCFVFPVTGYFTAVPTVYTNVKEIVSTDENPIPDNVDELLLQIDTISNVKTVNDSTKNYFNKLVSYKDGDKSTSALDDFVTITSLVPPVLRFANSVGDMETMDVDAVREVINIIKDNTKLRTITAEMVSVASQKWVANQPFMGFNLKESLDPDYKDALDIVLGKLTTTTESTVIDDLNDLVDTIETVQLIYHYANLLNNKAALDELNGALKNVLDSLNQDTADIMNSLVDDNAVKKFGITDEKSATVVRNLVADVVSSALDAEAQTESDAKAINSIINFATGGDISAKDVVENIAESSAVQNAIDKALTVEEGESAPYIAVENRDKIAEALNDESLEIDDELKGKIKDLFGIHE